MIASAVFVASVLVLACGLYLIGELKFLAAYRLLIVYQYGTVIGWFTCALFFNLFAAVYALNRKLFLKDTGKKLAHVEKQLRSGSSISEELSERLAE